VRIGPEFRGGNGTRLTEPTGRKNPDSRCWTAAPLDPTTSTKLPNHTEHPVLARIKDIRVSTSSRNVSKCSFANSAPNFQFPPLKSTKVQSIRNSDVASTSGAAKNKSNSDVTIIFYFVLSPIYRKESRCETVDRKDEIWHFRHSVVRSCRAGHVGLPADLPGLFILRRQLIR